jgi:hypothetical protein
LQVIDSGPGIAPDDLARLFEPFFSTREGGLGLGLCLSESLAHGMGGRLTAAAHAPRGAVFTLALRAFLSAHGEVPDRPLVVSVPVSVHGEVTDGRATNQVSNMFVRLPVHVGSVEQLHGEGRPRGARWCTA